jgi:hypothetical protein
VQAGLDRPERRPQQGRDLPELETFDVVQLHGSALLGRQGRDRLVHEPMQLERLLHHRGRGHRAEQRRLVDRPPTVEIVQRQHAAAGAGCAPR